MDEVISDVFRKLSQTNFSEGSMHWVHITHLNDPHNFYVRLTCLSTFLTEKMSNNLDKHLQKPDKINPGDVVIYENTKRQGATYFRGQITSIVEDEDTRYNIFAMDYGFIDKEIKLESIWSCNNIYSQVPPLAICCELDQCQPVKDGEWAKKSIDAMKFYVGNERAKVIIKGNNNGKLIVELINTCPDDIATMLAITGFSTFGYAGPAVSRLGHPEPKKQFYCQKSIKVDDKLHVRVVYGKSIQEFYVADKCDFAKYIQQKRDIARSAKLEKAIKGEDLKENMPVLVTTDYVNYERGLIKKITVPDTKVLADLVDLGKSVEVSILNLKTISEWLLHAPIAMCCCADDSQVWDTCLQKLIYPGYEFYITIKKLSDELVPYVVNISQK